MKNLSLILALALAPFAFAQTTPPTATTLTYSVAPLDQAVILASTSGLAAGNVIYIDRETMAVVSVSGTTVRVNRGIAGTLTAHLAATTAYYGARTRFLSADPVGSCSAVSGVYVNPGSGNTWSCTSGAWAQQNGGGSSGSTGLADPGSNGIVKRTAPNVTGLITFSDIVALFSGCTGTEYLGVDGGCHTASGSGNAGQYAAVTYSATPTLTCTSNTANFFSIVLTGNVTSTTLSGCSSGATIFAKVTQDATGNRTFVWPANFLGAGIVDGTPSSSSIQSFAFDGTNAVAMAPMAVIGGAAGLVIPGSSSGSTALSAPATGTYGQNLPASNGTMGIFPTTPTNGDCLNASVSGGVITLADSLQPCFTASASSLGSVVYGTAGGTAQAQTVTLSPAVTSLAPGLRVCWIPSAANTATAPTLAVNSLTATTVIKAGRGGFPLGPGDLSTTGVACAMYDGTAFELQTAQSSTSVVRGNTAASVAASTTFYSPFNSFGQRASDSLAQEYEQRAGMAYGLALLTSGTQAGSGSLTVTLRKNGADCGTPAAVSVVIPASGAGGTVQDTTNICTWAPGDLMNLKTVNAATVNSLTVSGYTFLVTQ